jgi:hypothetical protein
MANARIRQQIRLGATGGVIGREGSLPLDQQSAETGQVTRQQPLRGRASPGRLGHHMPHAQRPGRGQDTHRPREFVRRKAGQILEPAAGLPEQSQRGFAFAPALVQIASGNS